MLIALVTLLSSFQGSGVADEYAIKGMFVYNFTKYIDWSNSTQGANFSIAVYGKSAIYQSLQQIASNKKINNKSIVVRQVTHAHEAMDCQIIFIPRTNNPVLHETIEVLGSKGILIITEDKDMALKGSCINIITIDGKIKFELNETAVRRDGLKVASQLESLAIRINQ